MVKICVSGSKGRMGRRIVELSKDEPDIELAGEFDVGVDPEPLVAQADCLIDFTTPEATIAHLGLCVKAGKAMVIGTTGLSESDLEAVKEAARQVPIVLSPNMSVGVNTLFKLVEDAARTLKADYKVSILEAHHTGKKDAPSGTAKELRRVIQSIDAERDVPIESVREDEIVGEHTVTFESPYDVVELTHSAKTRDIFATGALEAAKYAVTKKSGLYSMKDVLSL